MSSKAFTRQKFDWLAQIKSDHAALPPRAVLVALQFIEYFNEGKDGAAWPSYKTVGDKLGLSEHTIIRVVHALTQRGHLRVAWGRQGRGHANRYWMILKPAQAQVFEPQKPASNPPQKTCKPGKYNLQSYAGEPL
jgi:hypothetical protein